MEEQGWLPRAGNMQLNPHIGLLLLPNGSSTYFPHPLNAYYVPDTLIGISHSMWQQLPPTSQMRKLRLREAKNWLRLHGHTGWDKPQGSFQNTFR